MRKRERTREKALELKQMQKMFLLKTMSGPGIVLFDHVGFLFDVIDFFSKNNILDLPSIFLYFKFSLGGCVAA